MRVELLYFGVLKEQMGRAGETVELPDRTEVGALLLVLRNRTSNNQMEERVWQSLAVAVNREYAAVDLVLRDGDEVALLPPVSGGAGER
jgi:molybdopterin converting factor subunit 1